MSEETGIFYKIVGAADCPRFARTENIAKELQARLGLAESQIQIEMQHPAEWEQYFKNLCDTYGFQDHHAEAVTKLESVLVWNFKTGRLVGGAKAFRKQVKEKYNVEPSVSWSQCQEIANENMQLFIGQQSFIKQQEFLKQNKCLSLAIAGPPCTEVSTYAQLLCKDFGAKLLRPAAVIEKHMNDGTLLGRAANLKVERGLEVPHTLLAQMYIEEIKSSECRRNGFVMDGFPFTKEQALQLEAAGVEVEVFIKLSLGDSAILEKANEQKLNVNDVVAQLRTFNENIVGTSSVYQEVMFEVGVAGDQKSIYQQILQQTREQLGFEL